MRHGFPSSGRLPKQKHRNFLQSSSEISRGCRFGAEDREAGSHKRMLDDFNLRVVCSGSHNFLASLTQIILELCSRALPLLFVDLGMKREITAVHNQHPADGRKNGVQKPTSRRYPIGAELIGPNQTHFRVWAPKASRVDLVLEESSLTNARRSFHPLAREDRSADLLLPRA